MTETTIVSDLMCDFCGWEDGADWIGVWAGIPDAMMPYEREGYSLCGFCYRSLAAMRFLRRMYDRHAPSTDFTPDQDRAQFANIQRWLTLGRTVPGPEGRTDRDNS